MNRLQQKLYDHEVPPPASSWDRINAALNDERSMYGFPERLYKLEVAPPQAVWDRILPALGDSQPSAARGRVIPLFIKYAVAASIVIALALFAFLNSRNSKDTPAIAQQVAPPVVPGALPVGPGPVTEAPVRQGLASVGRQVSAVRPVNQATAMGKRTTNVTPDDQYANSLYAYEDDSPDLAERYIMLMTPDGGFIRMSKKLGALLCCVTGQEQDEECRNQIRKWQQEIAGSPVAGPDNVLGLLDLVNSLNNGTQL